MKKQTSLNQGARLASQSFWTLACLFKYLSSLAAVLLLLSPRAAFAAEPSSPITVGVILPLSGDYASLGAASKNGITLALEHLSPEERARVNLVFEDDELKPTKTVSSFHRMLATNKLDAVINISSGTGLALAPVAESKNVPMIAVATNPAISAGRKNVVTLWVTPEAEIAAVLPELKRRGYRSLAVITTIQEGFLQMKKVFEQEARGVTIVVNEEVNPDVRDFRPFIAKMRAQKADGIFVMLGAGQLAPFAKQVRDLKFQVPLFGLETFEDSAEIGAADGALKGAWYVSAAEPSGDFLSQYRARFPNASTTTAANSYDALRLILAGSKTPEGINHFLHTVRDFTGALGTFSATSDNRFTLPAGVREVE